ncbi:hypothetical protein L6R50_24045 [Myxococcota bacterium]|nr:hypothetical protein [Myxococcota bacterium]
MSRAAPCLAIAALALACAAPAGSARAATASGFSMEVRVDGRAVREYVHKGKRYVEALPDREYTVRLTNHTSRRAAIALAVDGLNSIDARHGTAAESRKWVVEPYGHVDVPGWQVEGSAARRFYFTTEGSSYGAWLGDTRNLGTISAAVFYERWVPPPPPEPDWEPEEDEGWGYGAAGRERSGLGDSAGGEARSPSAAAPRGQASGAPRSAPTPSAKAESSARRSADDYAATGIGRRVGHRVEQVHLDLESAPAATISLRYEYRPELVRLGVIPSRPPRDRLRERERASGFAPDPFAVAPDVWAR